MPNYCNFDMKVIGLPSALAEFICIIKALYYGDEHDPKHFYRVFDFTVTSMEEDTIYGYGFCAWSVQSCFMPGGYHDPNNTNNGTTLPEVCKELSITVEVFASEPGMCFCEHLIIDHNGDVLCDDIGDYYEFDNEITLEEFNRITDLDWTQEQLDNYFTHEDYYVYSEIDLNNWTIGEE